LRVSVGTEVGNQPQVTIHIEGGGRAAAIQPHQPVPHSQLRHSLQIGVTHK